MLESIMADEARDLLLSLPVRQQRERVALSQALGRVLAEDVCTAIPMPPFDRSPFDGYALRWQDTVSASREQPAELRITEEIPAGCAPTRTVEAGWAAKILTGAPIPPGASGVVKFEDTEADGERVRVFAPVQPDQNVICKGEERQPGERLLSAGTLLTPAELGLLASQGLSACTVYCRPTVALLTTGSELAPAGTPLALGQIYDSNLTMLGALLEKVGFSCRLLGAVRDDGELIAAKLRQGLEQADLVITTGGASVGDYDYARTAARLAGAEPLFWKVRMKPGACVLAAQREEKYVISLSGNPGAAAVCLLRVVLPFLKKCCGRRDVLPQEIRLPLQEGVKKASPVTRLLRGRLVIEEGQARLAENYHQGNGMISSLCGFELLGEIPAGSPPLPAGTMIRAYRFDL